jgi:hypothetical protein
VAVLSTDFSVSSAGGGGWAIHLQLAKNRAAAEKKVKPFLE